MNGGDRWPRTSDRKIMSELNEMLGQAELASVLSRKTDETSKTVGAISAKPPLQRPFTYRAGASEIGQRDIVGQMWLEQAVAFDRQRRDERWMGHCGPLSPQVNKTELYLPTNIAIHSHCYSAVLAVNLPGKEN